MGKNAHGGIHALCIAALYCTGLMTVMGCCVGMGTGTFLSPEIFKIQGEDKGRLGLGASDLNTSA